MPEQNQTQRYDAGKPPYHLLPPEFIKFAYANPLFPYANAGPDIGAAEALSQLEDWVQNPEATADYLPMPSIGKELDDMCYVLGFGAQKYSDYGWERNPMTYTRVYRSARSHALKEIANPGSVDEESGLPHLAHFHANIVFLITYQLRGYHDLDDRPDVGRGSNQEDVFVEAVEEAVDSSLQAEAAAAGQVYFGVAKAPFTPKAGELARLVEVSSIDGPAEMEALGRVVKVVEVDEEDDPGYRFRVHVSPELTRKYNGVFYIGADAVWERP